MWKKLFFHYRDKIKTKTVGLGDKEETGIYQTNKAGSVCMQTIFLTLPTKIDLSPLDREVLIVTKTNKKDLQIKKRLSNDIGYAMKV